MQATAVAVPVQNTGDAFKASLAGALNTLPFRHSPDHRLCRRPHRRLDHLLAARARGQALLHAVKFNDLARRSGFADFVQKMGVKDDSAGVIASIVKWFVRLITLVVAFDTLGLPAVSNVLQQLLLWLPNLVVALVVLVIGGLAANALSQLVRGATAEAGFSNPDMLATVTRVAVWAFTIVVAVNQLGIATTLINTLLIGVVGAFTSRSVSRSGWADGIGGPAARRSARNAEQAGPKLERAANAARQQAQGMAHRPRTRASLGAGHASRGVARAMAGSSASRVDRRRVERPGIGTAGRDGAS